MLNLALLLPTLLAPPTAPAPASADDPSAAMAEDVEILRRLLVRELGGTPNDSPLRYTTTVLDSVTLYGEGRLAASPDGFWNGTWSGGATTVDHSNGFHVPGTGAVLTVEMHVPVETVAVREEGEDAAGPEEQEDDWKAMEQAVRSGQDVEPEGEEGTGEWAVTVQEWQRRSPGAAAAVVRLDEKAVEKAVTAVLSTLAKHGARLEGLGDGESVTVCLDLEGGDGWPGASYFRPTAVDPSIGLGYPEAYGWYLQNAGRQTPHQRITIQIGRAGLRDLASTGGGAEQARERARVHRY
jgi:hypothetical protein